MSSGRLSSIRNKMMWVHILLLAAFAVLFAVYVFDYNRIQTVHKIERKSVHTGEDNMLSSLNVTAFSQDAQGRMWIGTSAGLNVYDGEGYVQFFHDPQDTTALPDDYINVIHRDLAGGMWVGTQNGLARYEGGYRFKRFPIPDSDRNITEIADQPVGSDQSSVIVGNGRNYHIVSSTGVVRALDAKHRPQRKEMENLHIDSVVLQKPKELISAEFQDAEGNRWIGLHNAGYRVISGNVAAYAKANDNNLSRITKGKDITSLARVGKYILAGTTLRLYVYDTETGGLSSVMYKDLFAPTLNKSSNTETVSLQEINNIVAHGEDEVWLINDYTIAYCRLTAGHLKKISIGVLCSNKELGTGTCIADSLFVSCGDGTILKKIKHGGLIPTKAELLANLDKYRTTERIPIRSQWYGIDTQLAALRNGNLMLFMRNMHVAVLSLATKKLTEIPLTGDVDKFANIDPAFVREDSRGNVWLGTRRSGLYKLDMHSKRVERVKFIDDVHIQGMEEDRRHRLWITTLKDIICYDPATGVALRNNLISTNQRNLHRQFFDLSLCLAPDSTVVFGSSDGCVFLPEGSGDFEKTEGKLHVVSMDIKNTMGEDLTINDRFEDGSHYTLSHKEKALTFRFFHPNYSRSSSLIYQFMMEGYDQTWRQPTHKNTAYFANLTPGNYTFRVRLISSPGLPPIDECSIHVRVKPAPWNSAAAWLVYLAVIGYLVYFLNSLYLRMKANRMMLQQEMNEREREQRTNEMNMNFFANISHEFRNPITLIAGPLISLKADSSLPASVHHTLNTVCVSVNRMLKLIDQMLDFNQLETDALRLKVARMDVAEVLRSQVELLTETAALRGIDITLDIASGNYEGWADLDKFEKILGNLFTNALKHTPDGGRIAVAASVSGDERLALSVFNSGSHIAEERLNDVFKRYYQIDNVNGSHHYGWGTGIGLYYVKRLVGLHHGEITVSNTSDGVVFSAAIPLGAHEYSDADRASAGEKVMQIPVESRQEQPAETEEETPRATALRRTKILIVDDDMDVAQYVRSLFAVEFDVENRYSAEAALRDMEQIKPDLIVSDVVMGEMSGWDFCRALKADLMYSHIPVVLVTAKSNIDEQIKGLQLGAIAYVTKPFDPAYLCAIVRSQLSNVQSVRKRLGENIDTGALADTLSEQDRKFMDELYALMEKRAGDMELSVTTICHDMLISQSKLTYKLRELTGDTPGTFFRKYKLNKAAQMLREGKHPVSEIATLTGFGTAAHFSVAFKKQFGVTPSEYTK